MPPGLETKFNRPGYPMFVLYLYYCWFPNQAAQSRVSLCDGIYIDIGLDWERGTGVMRLRFVEGVTRDEVPVKAIGNENRRWDLISLSVFGRA